MQSINPPEKEFFQSLKSDTLIGECESFIVRTGLQNMVRLREWGAQHCTGHRKLWRGFQGCQTSAGSSPLVQGCCSHTHVELERRSSHPAHDNPAAVSEQPYPLYLCSKQTARTPPHFEIIMVKSPLAGRWLRKHRTSIWHGQVIMFRKLTNFPIYIIEKLQTYNLKWV